MAQTNPDLFDEADVGVGRLVSHKAVKAWLLSWGTPGELPTPHAGD